MNVRGIERLLALISGIVFLGLSMKGASAHDSIKSYMESVEFKAWLDVYAEATDPAKRLKMQRELASKISAMAKK